MSMITPAGYSKFNWSPKAQDEKLTKTASSEDGNEVQKEEEKEEDVNPIYEAAKDFMGSGKDEDAVVDGEEKKDGLDVEEVSEKSESVSDAVKEVEEKAEAAEATVEAVKEAVDKIEEAVEGVKGAIGEEVEEVEIEIEDSPCEEKVEEKVDDEIIIESEPKIEEEACMAKDKKEVKESKEEEKKADIKEDISMEKSASTEEFIKIAKLSPANRSKLRNYWKNMLDYPADYVDLMTRDYEK